MGRKRKLYLVPIIHMGADMGSMASTLDKTATAELGRELWQRHKETVSGFWDAIALFFDSLDVNGFRVYQDGLVADRTEGMTIVRQGTSQGSKNYELIGRLLARGAVLMKTENHSLVRQEHLYLTKMTSSKSSREREVAALRYRLAQGKLLRQRDDFIANRINETLGQGETGILFVGAYHDVIPRLASDIEVTQLKDVERVREYHSALLRSRRYEQSLQKLSDYLVSPISDIPLS